MGDDRRVGPSDRRVGDRRGPSEQFQDPTGSNTSINNKSYISSTAFIITIVILLVITIGAIVLSYVKLNKKIDEFSNDESSYVDNLESNYTSEETTDIDAEDDSETYTEEETDSDTASNTNTTTNTNSTETTNNQ